MSTAPFLPLSDIVDVVVQLSPQLPISPTFNQGLIVGASGHIPTTGANSRIRKYSTLAGMAADGFLTTDPEYICASLYFGQSPATQYVWIGAQSPSGINAAVFHAGNAGAGYQVGDVVAVVQGAAVNGTLSVTAIGVGGAVTGLALATSGSGYTVAGALATTGGHGAGLEVDISAVGEPLLQAVIACRAAQSAWYAVMGTVTADADVLALSLWAQSASPVSVFFYSTADVNVLNNVGGNLAAALQAADYSRAFGIYSTTQSGAFPNNVYIAAAAMGLAMGLNTGLPNSFYTMMFKQLVGVATEPLTQSQVSVLLALNINLYLNYGNAFTFLQAGAMPNGQRFWQIINIDMLVSNIQFNILDLFISVPAVPQTDPGETQLIHAVNQAAAAAALIGFIAGGIWEGVTVLNLKAGDSIPSGYLAQAPPYSTQSPANHAARQAMPIYLAIVEAGAVESILIGVYVQQ